MTTRGASQWYYRTRDIVKEIVKSPLEASAITRELLRVRIGYDNHKHVIDQPITITTETLSQLADDLQKIKENWPVQYIVGVANFCDKEYIVTYDVLIPRCSTEAVVNHLIANPAYQQEPPNTILDLCTGSGCIAITLAHHWPNAHIEGHDISKEALAVAEKNGQKHHVNITWQQRDILQDNYPLPPQDIIISNPPYLIDSDKEEMHARVLDHEPHIALFGPKHHPPLHYEKIATIAKRSLTPRGTLYTEVHEDHAVAIVNTFKKKGLYEPTIHRDIQGFDRWITAKNRPNQG